MRVVDIPDDRIDGARRRTQRIEPRFLEANLVIVDVTHETVQCGGHCNTSIDVRHIGAAMQCVAGAVQFVGNVERRCVSFASLEVVRDDLEVACRLLREDVVEDRIHLQRHFLFRRHITRWLTDGQHRRIRIAFGEGTCPRNQQCDIGLWIGANFQLLDQFRHRGGGLHDKIHHGWRTFERAVNQPVQQVLDGPRIFTNALCPDHAPAALQRMERPPHGDQHLHIVRGCRPGRQVPLDGRDFLFGLLDEDLEKLGVQVFGIRRNDR